MYLALYKGPASGLWLKLGHAVTAWRTKSKYSHCELVLGNIDMDGMGLCASASLRDGGVRVKRIEVLSGHWDIINLHHHGFTADDERYARMWFDERVGAKYDFLGLLFFLVPVRTEHQQRWFCSEAVGAALRIPKPYKLSPESLNQLYR